MDHATRNASPKLALFGPEAMSGFQSAKRRIADIATLIYRCTGNLRAVQLLLGRD
jgi:hypothetical protein